jgi:hypothetical protein
MENNMKLYDLEYFSIFHKNELIETLKDIEVSLRKAYNKVRDFYNINMEKINVYIYDNQVEFQRQKIPMITEENKIDWWVGETVIDKILAVSPTLETNSWHNYQSILDVIAHEYIHIVNNKINKDRNIWIDEGIALYLINGIKSKEILKNNKIPTIEIFNLNNASSFYEENGYIFADKIIEYINLKYGKEKIIMKKHWEKILK